MFTIGDFSTATGLPVKTLRFYHDKGLLVPAAIDRESGYRYYDRACLERARMIVALRDFEFSLEEIGEILTYSEEEGDILEQLEQQKAAIAEKIERQRDVTAMIDRIITAERESQQTMAEAAFVPEVKAMEPVLLAGVRLCGRYSDCGPAYATLGRRLGRHIAGKAVCLYYDGEYRETDANFEPCMPVKKAIEIEGINMHQLPAGRCVSLIHLGPYEALHRSYAVAFSYASENNLEVTLPTREVYIKGPGMIFKGKASKYLTEIQLPVA